MSKIIPFYKSQPPFMKYEGGHGFKGVILWDSENDKIQCHICGRWFVNIGWLHLKTHDNMTPTEYKMEVGLALKTPLLNLQATQEKSARVKEEYKTNENFKESARGFMESERQDRSKKGGEGRRKRVAIQEYNKFGTCELQLKDKLQKLVDKFGHTPTFAQANSLAYVLARRFGSYTKGIKALGFMPTERQRGNFLVYSSEELLGKLIEFKEIFGKEPTTDDFRVRHLLPFSDDMIRRRFGTLENARRLAYK